VGTLAALFAVLGAGCDREPAPTEAGATTEELAQRAAATLGDERFATADLRRGEVLSLACQVCHSLSPEENIPIAPNLGGVFGRRAATLPGFAYSDALRAADVVWSAETLDAWLAAPDTFVAGTTMVFAGYGSTSDRRDLIAYLALATRSAPAD
jgi:cytochrome c